MLRKLINRIEENYVFNISQFFWHIFIALAGLGIVGGILLLVWGIIPAFKSSLEKEQYPPMVSVSVNELKTFINPPKRTEREPSRQQEAPPPVQSPVSSGASSEEIAYRASVDTMQALIPPAKYTWSAGGHYEYPYGPNYPQYARWVQGEPAILDRLETTFSSEGITSFTDKKQLLDAHIAVVRLLKEEFRMPVWKTLIGWSEPNLAQALSNTKLLASLVPRFPADRYDYMTKLAQFGDKNPKDGNAFVEYITKSIEKFPTDNRMDVVNAMITAYYRYFNNRVTQQIELTETFFPMLTQFDDVQGVKALEAYYQLALQKNYERSQMVARIENKFEQEQAKAAAEYEMAKAKKSAWRLNGVYGVAGGVVLVATIGLLLVLLSIQRYVKQIDIKLTSNVSAPAGQ